MRQKFTYPKYIYWYRPCQDLFLCNKLLSNTEITIKLYIIAINELRTSLDLLLLQ